MSNFAAVKAALAEKKLDESFSKAYLKEQYDEQYERFLGVLSDFSEQYGENDEREIALFSCKIGFTHPKTGENMSFFSDETECLILKSAIESFKESVKEQNKS